MGWSFSFKLHLIINHLGEIMSLKLTQGNTDNRKPVLEWSRVFLANCNGDKDYISHPLTGELLDKGVEFITTIRKNMKKSSSHYGGGFCSKSASLLKHSMIS
ncbi:MAG: hypothetical protein CENE_01798 [Candidatus Celerinatantimonas neptuna]|nr:MAG: hypothetical protein CENE_01798 [Candidatus Celerinatantimonas neptuna]